MKKFTLVGLVGLLVFAGCKQKPKDGPQVSREAHEQALQLASEGEFSTTVHDFAAAENSLTKAVELDPTIPRYWKELGAVRKHLNKTDAARDAYQKSFDLLEAARQKDPGAGGLVLGEVETLVLMGKNDDARELLKKTVKAYPQDKTLQQMVQNNIVEKMAADPTIKSSIL